MEEEEDDSLKLQVQRIVMLRLVIYYAAASPQTSTADGSSPLIARMSLPDFFNTLLQHPEHARGLLLEILHEDIPPQLDNSNS